MFSVFIGRLLANRTGGAVHCTPRALSLACRSAGVNGRGIAPCEFDRRREPHGHRARGRDFLRPRPLQVSPTRGVCLNEKAPLKAAPSTDPEAVTLQVEPTTRAGVETTTVAFEAISPDGSFATVGLRVARAVHPGALNADEQERRHLSRGNLAEARHAVACRRVGDVGERGGRTADGDPGLSDSASPRFAKARTSGGERAQPTVPSRPPAAPRPTARGRERPRRCRRRRHWCTC